MRAGFGLITLLLAMLIVFWLVKSQTAPVVLPADTPSAIGQGGTPQQVQDAYRKALEDAMAPARERSADE